MASTDPPSGQLRAMVQEIARETIIDYLDSEEGKGHLVRLLDELENDKGHWITIISGSKDEGTGHD